MTGMAREAEGYLLDLILQLGYAFIETWRSWVENPQRMIAEGV